MNPAALHENKEVPAISDQLRPRAHAWGIVLILTLVALTSYRFPALWELWQINHYPTFIDAAVIVAGAESVRHHIDPMYFNPYDAFHRTLNYPRIWQALAVVLTPGSTLILAFTFWGAFLGSLIPVIRQSRQVPVLIVVASIFNPSVILALERGNCDLLIMALIVAAVCAFEYNRLLSFLLWIAATVLKLYPLFAAAYLIGPIKRREFYLAVAVLLIPALYEIQNIHDLSAIRAGTPDTIYGYGRACLPLVAAEIGFKIGPPLLLGYWILLASPLLGVRASLPEVNNHLPSTDHRYRLSTQFFLAGAGVFLGTFLLGSNHEYRQIWLILCLPHLFSSQSSLKVRVISRCAALSILTTLWSPVIIQFVAGELSSPTIALLFTHAIKGLTYICLGLLWTGMVWERVKEGVACFRSDSRSSVGTATV